MAWESGTWKKYDWKIVDKEDRKEIHRQTFLINILVPHAKAKKRTIEADENLNNQMDKKMVSWVFSQPLSKPPFFLPHGFMNNVVLGKMEVMYGFSNMDFIQQESSGYSHGWESNLPRAETNTDVTICPHSLSGPTDHIGLIL